MLPLSRLDRVPLDDLISYDAALLGPIQIEQIYSRLLFIKSYGWRIPIHNFELAYTDLIILIDIHKVRERFLVSARVQSDRFQVDQRWQHGLVCVILGF